MKNQTGRTMLKHPFPTLLFIVLILLLTDIQCSKSESDSKKSMIKQPMEEYFMLDSTVIGITTILSGLEVPWEIAWGSDNWIWVAEQDGKISRLNPDTKETKLLLQVPDVFRNRLGLMSMVLHPDMENSPYVYLNYTFLRKDNKTSDKADNKGSNDVLYTYTGSIMSKVVRYTYTGNTLTNPLVLLEFPANTGHNGSRMVIAPDMTLIIATGDVDPRNGIKNGGNAQDIHTTGGKILRINLDGTIPVDNPIPHNPVWARGLRVPQGLVFSPLGKLYSAEHGTNIDDEINLINKDGNYGYPYVSGYCDGPEEMEYCKTHSIIQPLKAWTPTIAPAGMDFYNNPDIPEWQQSILLVTLKTQSLRVLKLNGSGDTIESEKVYFEKHFGRLRDLCVSPVGDVYISTSNLDWNPPDGFPLIGDDRIIRISAVKSNDGSDLLDQAISVTSESNRDSTLNKTLPGYSLYTSYCSSCHKEDGGGVKGLFPSLKARPDIVEDKDFLIQTVLNGLSGTMGEDKVKYDQKMPEFKFLKDHEIAEIVSYVRFKFGNNSSGVSPVEVSKIRDQKE